MSDSPAKDSQDLKIVVRAARRKGYVISLLVIISAAILSRLGIDSGRLIFVSILLVAVLYALCFTVYVGFLIVRSHLSAKE